MFNIGKKSKSKFRITVIRILQSPLLVNKDDLIQELCLFIKILLLLYCPFYV